MKMSTALIVAAAAGFAAASANAQLSSRVASNFGSGTGTTEGTSTYQVDDGISENSVGLTAGGEIAWLNAFTVSGGLGTITSIDVAFGSSAGSGLVGGEAFNVYVWSGTPTGTNALLATAAGNVTSFDQDIFQNIAISANVGGNGSQFFIGASLSSAAGVFPAPLDQTSDAGVSYFAGSLTQGGFDPNNLAANDLPPGLTGGFGLPGNVLIRANAIPTPGVLGLFGIAGLAATRRRR